METFDKCGDHDKNKYVCSEPDCHKVFSRPSRLQVHLRTHTGEKPFLCDVPGCGHAYARTAHLKRHFDRSHCEDDPLQKILCRESNCKDLFASEDSLKKHMKRFHIVHSIQCPHDNCTELFKKHSQLKAHLSSFHMQKLSFKCNIEGCDKEYDLAHRLTRHMKVHRGYTCSNGDCSMTFYKWSLLRKHIAEHHKKVHKCSECSTTFKHPHQLTTHHAKTHSANSKPMFVCPVAECGRVYYAKRNLNTHVTTRHEGKLFKCDHCEKEFSYKKSLQQHQKVHQPGWSEYLREQQQKKYPRRGHRRKKTSEKILGMSRTSESNSESSCESEDEIFLDDTSDAENTTLDDVPDSDDTLPRDMDSVNISSGTDTIDDPKVSEAPPTITEQSQGNPGVSDEKNEVQQQCDDTISSINETKVCNRHDHSEEYIR